MVQVLLPKNKTKQLFSATNTEAGVDEVVLALEDNGAIVTLFVSELGDNQSIYVEIHEMGDNPDDLTTITSSTTITTANTTPYKMTIFPSSSVHIKVYYSGSVSYYLRAKSISSSADGQQDVMIDLLQETKIANQQIIGALTELNENLTLLVNHARMITGINEDEGEDF